MLKFGVMASGGGSNLQSILDRIKILEARQLSKAIPLKKAQEVVKNLIEIYKNERIDDETFENFDSRVLSNLTVEEIQSKIGL